MVCMSWIAWAILSAVFAAATALLAKVGLAHVDSNLATAIRTTVVLIFAWLLLGEKLTPPVLFGGLLITAGAVVMVLG